MRTGIAAVAGTAVALALIALAGCATAGAGGAGEALTWDAGLATHTQTQQEAARILRRHEYDIAREEGPPAPFIETSWRTREPFEDERGEGVEEARTRFIVEARPRRQVPDGEDIYTVRVRAENQGRGAGSPEWTPLSPTRQFRSYADEIAREVRAGLGG